MYLSFAPGDNFPKVGVVNFDKFVHTCIYFVQTFFFITAFYRKFPENKKKFLLLPLLIGLITGLGTEILQGTTLINRNADWLDMMANSIGVLVAVLSFKTINKGFIKRNIKWF